MLSDAKSLGIEFVDEAAEPENFEIWIEHHQSVLMFLRCQTQWRTGPSGPIGLDYGVVLQVFKLYDLEDQQQVFDDLQTMEGRALELFHDDAERQAKQSRRARRN